MPEIAISFFGAAQQVTGACYLIEAGDKKILIDCGLIQGGRFCEGRNGSPFLFDPASIDAVMVTHAHLDHVGRIPRLVREGFRGTIYSTPPTKDLAELLIRDGLTILQKEARACAEPALYAEEDIENAFRRWRVVAFRDEIVVGPAIITFRMAGHILGAAMLEIDVGGKKLLITGDVNFEESLLLPASDLAERADYLVIEATYGNKTHQSVDERTRALERALEDNAAKGGTLMIPAFATERTQDLIFEINEMMVERRVPQTPVFVDSPLAIRVTEVFEKYRDYYNDRIKTLYRTHPHLFQSRALRMTPSVEESKAINDVPPPKVIIAGSGMMTGGRILHHLKRYLPDDRSTLLITGYQAAGSLGRRILEGAGEVKIFDERVPVRAALVLAQGYSAHADKDKLFRFVSGLRKSLKHMFAVHGEAEPAMSFVYDVRDRLGIPADAPLLGDRFVLE